MNRKRVKILQAAKALIATEDTWTTGAQARTKTGRRVYADNPKAMRFCLGGALVRAMGLRRGDIIEPWPRELYAETYNLTRIGIMLFDADGLELNNEHGFDAVHIVLDAAIADARKQVSP